MRANALNRRLVIVKCTLSRAPARKRCYYTTSSHCSNCMAERARRKVEGTGLVTGGGGQGEAQDDGEEQCRGQEEKNDSVV